ncbi:MAG: TrkA family potassium uptake protein [Ignavibacteriae bacterium]|nr:TrkA family potassium uptake protein [Ignavibacteriota bacterium]MCB0725773.1 TrkA family potassium uptake protein [Ignavibacteriota bacterium]MCB9244738.1 TrkA family potassium uptake protein [Ignavibacteriales bacterium]
MKQFVVIGLGRFGSNLATTLYKLGNQVLALDQDKQRVEKIKDSVTEAIIANAKDVETLSEFIDKDIDTVILATGTDIEMSVLSVLYLKQIGVKHIIAKAKNDDHGKILKSLGVEEVIFPERDIAERLAERLNMSSLIAHIPLAPEYSIVEIATPEKFFGKSLEELDIRNKYGITVVGIKDVLMDTIDISPKPDKKLPPDSAMILVCKTDEIEDLTFE